MIRWEIQAYFFLIDLIKLLYKLFKKQIKKLQKQNSSLQLDLGSPSIIFHLSNFY